MSVSQSTPLRFSRVRGMNVCLTSNNCSSTWKTDKHFGYCTVNRPLSKGETIELKFAGSGHVYIGLLKIKLTQTYIVEGRSPDSESVGKWMHFRLKHNEIVVKVQRTSSKEVTTFISGLAMKPEVFKIDECWVCCDVLFGDLEVKIMPKDKHSERRSSSKQVPPFTFDPECGSNVSITAEATLAKLKNANPCATCCTDRPVVPGEVIEVKVEPVEAARWTYVNVYMSNLSSKDLKIDRSDFECTGSDVKTWLRSVTSLTNSQETFTVRVTNDGKIAYTVCGKETICDAAVLDLLKPIYVYFDLFRVSLTLSSILPSVDDADYPKMNDLCLPQNQHMTTQDPEYLTLVHDNSLDNGSDGVINDHYTTLDQHEYDDFIVVKGNASDTKSAEEDGASGPVPEVGITIGELDRQIDNLRSSVRAECGQYKDRYSGPLIEIRQRLVSIEESSSVNHDILQTIKSLEIQVTDLMSEVSLASQSKPSADSEAPPSKSLFETCIRPNYNTFLSDMESDSVIDCLFQYDVITTDQMDKIHGMTKAERRNKNREILKLMRHKEHQMNLFKKALIEAGNDSLAQLIN